MQLQNLAEARQLFYQQFKLLRFIVTGGLSRAIQAGLQLQGQEAGELRAPLQPLTVAEQRELQHILDRVLLPSSLLQPTT